MFGSCSEQRRFRRKRGGKAIGTRVIDSTTAETTTSMVCWTHRLRREIAAPVARSALTVDRRPGTLSGSFEA